MEINKKRILRAMHLYIILISAGLLFSFCNNENKTVTTTIINDTIIPVKNKKIIQYAIDNGRSISPTYQSAVCTEFVIGVLQNFIPLTNKDKNTIRIITSKSIENMLENNSEELQGVCLALKQNGKGNAVDIQNVLPGDFVQFWYSGGWGHCGIVSSIDIENKTMTLHSSYPSTNGYGIQTFDIPERCWFARLK